jgi:hypothetical protein
VGTSRCGKREEGAIKGGGKVVVAFDVAFDVARDVA